VTDPTINVELALLGSGPRWPSDDLAPERGDRWDLLVIGGGTAGLVAARTASSFGAKVLLVERDRTGGDCLWTGCVPSKALLSAAHAAADAKAAGRYGVDIGNVRIDFPLVMNHVGRAITAIEPVDSPAALRADGVRVVHGNLRLLDKETAEVDGEKVTFRQAIVATGSAPVLPPIPGLAEAEPLTSDNVWSLTTLPARLLVLGGGSIGCELGQAFARLGSAVTIVEAASRLVIREDADAASVLASALTTDGLTLRTAVAVTKISRADGSWSAELADGSTVGFDRILVAVGRRPRTAGLGLEQAGIDTDDRGYVKVDQRLRTTNPRIWAAGDVTGHPAFTHVAGVHGSLAASNAALGLRRTVSLNAIPRVTFTQPEIAAVGVSTDPSQDTKHTIRTIRHNDVDRAVAEGQTDGFTRLAFNAKGRVIGATIVGPRAGESLNEVVLAIQQGLRGRDVAAAIHPYPTYSDGVWKVAIEQVQNQLQQPAMKIVTSALSRIRRRRLSS
jgi:pyruvate/2-oxoglutarate dehydrogenase complex dihydrolipoamide dehydrogenase (E3) component